MMQKIWCRLQLADGSYHYVYVPKEMALALCIHQGYEINCEPPKDRHKYE